MKHTPNSPAYSEYCKALRTALAEPGSFDFLDEPGHFEATTGYKASQAARSQVSDDD